MRSLFAEPPPETAEVFERLKIHRYEFEGGGRTRYGLKVWRGKQSRPFVNVYYATAEARERNVEGIKEGEAATLRARAERAKAAKSGAAKMREELTVGTLLHGSWGYDQTNCELWEVVGRPSPAYAEIRRVRAESTGATGPFSESVRPLRGETYGPTVRKLVNEYGISFEHFTLTPTSGERSFHSSWGH